MVQSWRYVPALHSPSSALRTVSLSGMVFHSRRFWGVQYTVVLPWYRTVQYLGPSACLCCLSHGSCFFVSGIFSGQASCKSEYSRRMTMRHTSQSHHRTQKSTQVFRKHLTFFRGFLLLSTLDVGFSGAPFSLRWRFLSNTTQERLPSNSVLSIEGLHGRRARDP